MSLFKSLTVVSLLFAVQACGFTPLYQHDKSSQPTGHVFDTILVLPIADRAGQGLRNHLNDVLTPKGRPANPDWTLKVTLTESIEKISVEQTSFSTRANLRLTGFYVLSPVGSIEGVRDSFGRSASAISSYNILDSEYATLVAERDARSRAIQILGNDIRRQIAILLNNQTP